MTSPLPLLRSYSTDEQGRDWRKRFSLRSKHRTDGKDMSKEIPLLGNKKSRCGGRRCSSLKQQNSEPKSNVALELASAPTTQFNSINECSPKKPKWEVIEHFKTNVRGQESISSSLIAVSLIIHFILQKETDYDKKI